MIEAVERGLHPEDAAIAFGCGRSTVYGWLASYDAGGFAALTVRKAPGAAPKLSEKQISRLRQWIVGKDPRQLQFDYALWTREIIRDLIERDFGAVYTLQGLGKLLSRLGLSPQRPARGKLYFRFMGGNTNAATFTRFLEDMLHDIPGIIFLVVDGHSAHTAAVTRNFAEKNRDRLRLFYLPRCGNQDFRREEQGPAEAVLSSAVLPRA